MKPFKFCRNLWSFPLCSANLKLTGFSFALTTFWRMEVSSQSMPLSRHKLTVFGGLKIKQTLYPNNFPYKIDLLCDPVIQGAVRWGERGNVLITGVKCHRELKIVIPIPPHLLHRVGVKHAA